MWLILKQSLFFSFIAQIFADRGFWFILLKFNIQIINLFFCPSEEILVFDLFYGANKQRGVEWFADVLWIHLIIVKTFLSRLRFRISTDRLHPHKINPRISWRHLVVLLVGRVLNIVDGNAVEVATHFFLQNSQSCWLFFCPAYITSQNTPKIVIHY